MSATLDRYYAAVTGHLQCGPVYRCWLCDRPVSGMQPYHACVQPPTDLDPWAHHIAYLDLHTLCAGHPCRVAVVGPAITPLHWPDGAVLAVKAGAVEAAIARLTRALNERQPEAEGNGFSPAMALVARIYARAITPAAALLELQALVGAVAPRGRPG